MQNVFFSSVGKKVLTSITGLGLVMFVVVHLAGNLTLLLGPEAFNSYAHCLEMFLHGWFIYLAEAGLAVCFIVHAIFATTVTIDNIRARKEHYYVVGDARGASRKTLSSKTMIYTGALMLIFVILHLRHFKFGPNVDAGYVAMVHGEEVRDLYRHVAEQFKRPWVAIGYAVLMVVLGLHLRHGAWSAFQSLGLATSKLLPIYVGIAILLAIVMVTGFVVPPLYILFFVDPAAVGHAAGAGG